MLQPSRTKYRRPHRLSYEGKAKGGKKLEFGDYGLVATRGCYITNNQIEAARVAMTRKMGRRKFSAISIPIICATPREMSIPPEKSQ